MTPLLLIEDDDNLAASLRDYLRGEGYELRRAANLAEGRAASREAHALVILDWMLPDGAGVDLLREWRKQGSETPVILLTARTDLVDRVVGLELGADDYVTKPFEPRELLARIRARLRARATSAPAGELLEHGALALDLERRELRVLGQTVALSRQEYALLEVLMRSPGRVFSREELLNAAWGYEHFPTTRTVDTHVLQLRQKVGSERIETVRGVGYRLRAED